ncbi:MAG TPA: glycosyltransferase 87 family protein [Pyrinomonadaceae bacterium]|nr:glycosyltransferase 87 family protein [Pyrinomonadaceae bacterium]
MKLKQRSLENIILIVGACVFFWILLLPKPGPAWVYYDTIKYGSATLKGQIPFSDFVQEVVGFRALYNRTDPYPVLGPELKKSLDIDWGVVHGSTHPPTSFLLAAPVAFFSWPVASAIWAWLMLCLMVLSFRFYGLTWRLSLGLMPLTLLWPPASASLGQTTIVWMFGLSVAYYFRERRLFWSGASIGLASLTKYFPGLVIIIFLLKRKWAAILGFVLVWVLALSLITLMNPATLPRYFEEQFVTKRVYDANPDAVPMTTTSVTMRRTDNTAPLVVSYRYGGLTGLIFLILFFSIITFTNRRYFYGWKTSPSMRLWMLLCYFAVACLPIFWIYSLMPLLPVVAFFLFERKIVTTVIALYAILIPSIYIQGGEQAVIPIASVSVFLGLAFILDRLPLQIFQMKWGENPLVAD